MSGDSRNRYPSVRPSRVDAGWEEVPSVVPEDTMLDPSVDSKELTAPHPSSRFSDLGVPIARKKTVIGVAPPGPGAPAPYAQELPTPASSGPSMQTAPQSSGRFVQDGGPVSRPLPRSAPPPPPAPSAPPPPPSSAGRYGSYGQDQYAAGEQAGHEPPPADFGAPPPDYGAPPPPPPSHPDAYPGVPPSRRPYDSLESIHSISDFASTSSLTTDPSVDLESLEATQERRDAPAAPPPPAPDAGRPMPPMVSLPSESSGTRQLQDIQAPPVHFVGGPGADAPASAPRSSMADLSSASPAPIAQALKQRVLVGSARMPLWGAVIGAVAVAASLAMLFSGVATALVARRSAPQALPPTPAIEVDSSARPEVVAPPPAAPIATVDKAALAQIEKKTPAERSTAESFQLADGKRDERRAQLDQMAKELAGREPSADDVKVLREAVSDGEAGFAALRVMAALTGPVGPDLIYESWTKPRSRTPTTELAESLVYSKEVRAKASPALGIALDLRAVEQCDAALELVGKAAEVGDRRSVYPLSRLTRKSGCGETKREDCFPCLGKRKEVVEALRSVGRRMTPRY